uniref:MAR-binding filament-like protein 1-1 n=1 Tax=Anthurium amnicola TaxID=1678845 RepID=A0A1D1YV40_9ARAE
MGEVPRRKPAPMASSHPDGPRDAENSRRRALLLAGLSAFPLLQLRALAAAVEGLVRDKQDTKMTRVEGHQMQDSSSYAPQNETEVQAHVHQVQENPFVSLLNELGIIGLGVLGALYAISQKEKADMNSEIESMNTALNEKAAAKTMLEKNFERKLLKEQEEHHKQIKKLKEDEALLSKQLASAKSTVTALGHELQNEKRSVEEYKLQIDRLQSNRAQAGEDKRMLESELRDKLDTIDVLQDKVSLLSLEIKDKEKNIGILTSSLVEKESESKNLRSLINQTKVELEESNSVHSHLQIELLKVKEELDSKNSYISDMNMKMNSLLTERDDIDSQLCVLQREYNDLKSNFAQKSASDSELLSKKDIEVRQLLEKLGLALTEAKNNHTLIANLKNQMDTIKATLEEETSNAKILREELQITHETLRDSKLEVSDLLKQLKESNNINEELLSEVSKVKVESSEAQKLLNVSLEEARSTSELLSDELAVVKDIVKSTREEIAVVSDELKAAVEARENLKKQLLEVSKEAEDMGHELEEEKKVVAALNRELEASEKVVQKHSDARKILEDHLDEATKSLDEMNKKALSLSNELKNANSQTATLEAEKEMLYLSLMEQKNLTKDAKESIEDAQNVIKMLGAQRENLEKKVKKFEEELASAKGEILRFRRQIALRKESTHEHHKKVNDTQADASDVSKKNGRRRRKVGSASQVAEEGN